jgi:hypothetical protein
MRFYLVTALVVGGVVMGSQAASALPYFHRDTNGSWTDVEYNDGVCHYKYAHNAWDQETHVNRWGDCSGVAIGPNGEAAPVVTEPVLVPRY